MKSSLYRGVALTLAALTVSSAAMAEPPHWAPAYGYRDHHDRGGYRDRADHWRERGGWGHDTHHHKRKHKHHHHDDEDYVVINRPIYAVPAAPIYYTNRPYVQVRCDPNRDILTSVIGGTAGGLIGNQFGGGRGRTASIIAGTLIGAQLGRADRNCVAQAFEYARPGTQVTWQNPDNSAYNITPVRDYQQGGRYCREYQAKVRVGGRLQDGYGTACRQPDGAWEVIQ